MRGNGISFALGCCLILAGLQVRAKSFEKSSPELLAQGKQVFADNCVACHGVNGDGQGPAARAISGAKPRNFTEGKFKYGDSPGEIFATITKGSPGTAMPSWSSLPEKERWAVVHYVKSLKRAAKP